jgi:hypothetical protein
MYRTFPSVVFDVADARAHQPANHLIRRITAVLEETVSQIQAALVRHLIEEVRFASDSPLEGDGFEPSVPRKFFGRPSIPAQFTFRNIKPAPSRQGPMVRIDLPPARSLVRTGLVNGWAEIGAWASIDAFSIRTLI